MLWAAMCGTKKYGPVFVGTSHKSLEIWTKFVRKKSGKSQESIESQEICTLAGSGHPDLFLVYLLGPFIYFTLFIGCQQIQLCFSGFAY